MRATAWVGVHTHWQEVRQKKVSGRRSNKKCVSQLNGSVRLLRVSVCLFGASHTWGYYLPVSQTQVQTCPAPIPSVLSIHSDVSERLFVYLALIVEFLSCEVNAFGYRSWVSLNRMHSKSKTVWSLLEFDPLWILQDFSVPHFFGGGN